MPRLACCWIWGSPFVFSDAVESMLTLRHPPGCEVGFFRGTGWGPARRHIDACEKALAWDAEWILILGGDQIYDPDLLERLMARVEEGCEVVSALVPTRGYLDWETMKPFQPMAWRFKGNGTNRITQPRDALQVVKREDGDLQRIDLIGSGVLLFHRDHLLALTKPWFFETIDHETQIRTACMDTIFVHRLHREAHAQVWCDTTIRVRHAHVFPIDDSFSDRFADWATPGHGDPAVCQFQPLTA